MTELQDQIDGFKIVKTDERKARKQKARQQRAERKAKKKAGRKRRRHNWTRRKRLATIKPHKTERGIIHKMKLVAKLITAATGIKQSLDHIRPLNKGGAHHWRNIQIMPTFENCKKSDHWDGHSGWGYDELNLALRAFA